MFGACWDELILYALPSFALHKKRDNGEKHETSCCLHRSHERGQALEDQVVGGPECAHRLALVALSRQRAAGVQTGLPEPKAGDS